MFVAIANSVFCLKQHTKNPMVYRHDLHWRVFSMGMLGWHWRMSLTVKREEWTRVAKILGKQGGSRQPFFPFFLVDPPTSFPTIWRSWWPLIPLDFSVYECQSRIHTPMVYLFGWVPSNQWYYDTQLVPLPSSVDKQWLPSGYFSRSYRRSPFL